MTVQSSSTSMAQRFENLQPSKTILVWACVATAVATMIVGFGWGGWVTGSSSRAAAALAGNTARGELASAVCVEKFRAGSDAGQRIADFNALSDSYKKRQFVEAGGWATMPGQTTADRLGLQGCATALAAL